MPTANKFPITHIVIHHSVTYPNNRDGTPKTTQQIVDQVAAIHKKSGITGIGYNKLVLPNGKIYIARPDDIAPGSQMNYNVGTLSVCVIGYFHDNKDQLRPQQLAALRAVINSWQAQHPKAIVVGHRQIGDTKTVCPGDHLFDYVKSVYPTVAAVGTKRIRRGSSSSSS